MTKSWRRAPLYVRGHDLCVWIHRRRGGRDLPLLGRVEFLATELVGHVAEALSFATERDHAIDRADRCLVRMRVGLRLATELEGLTASTHRYLMAELDTIGRMLGGWRRSRRDGRTKSTRRLTEARI